VSEPLRVTTPPADPNDVTAPIAPTNVQAESFNDGSTELQVTWTASTDDVTKQAFIRYDVFVNGVLADTVVGTARSIVYGDRGDNVITVVGIDEAGNKSTPGTATHFIPF
jgi:hypothetical protein